MFKKDNRPNVDHLQNFTNMIHCGAKFWAIFNFRLPNPKIQNENLFLEVKLALFHLSL